MTIQLQAHRLNMRTFAQQGDTLSGTTPVQDMARLAHETQGLRAESDIRWEATAELRDKAGTEGEVWLHVKANAVVPLTCQRCMLAVQVPVDVEQSYRFVETEEIAMAEDDASEEDLLVMEPQFDLLNLLEDELLMGLPLVPMHDECPVAPVLSSGVIEVPGGAGDKPNPFAALAQLKKK